MNVPGDIILTRNTDEVGNETPGYWNHAAISTGKNIIEAQVAPNSVIITPFHEFYERYWEFIVLRYTGDKTIAEKAVEHAKTLVGIPYRKVASIFFFMRRTTRGENCVSVVRKAWREALGKDPGWGIPDSIQDDKRFKQIEHFDKSTWKNI